MCQEGTDGHHRQKGSQMKELGIEVDGKGVDPSDTEKNSSAQWVLISRGLGQEWTSVSVYV